MKQLELKYTPGTCVQCGTKFTHHTDLGEKVVSVCINPACPNFALLAISIENMPKEEK